ncbi:hypothetical protein ACET3Z_000133 [Daucus carota]
MNVGVIVSQEVDKVSETPMDVIPGFYVEECVSDRDMDIITGLESSLPEILNNAWCVRDRTSSQSSEQTSVKLLDNSEEELGNDLGVFDSEAVVPPKIIDQVTQLSIGRKRGRPRKYARVYSFADKRKGTNVRRNPPSAKKDLPVNKISVSKKEKRKNIRQSKLKELESLDKENSTAMGTGKDLALQVLETGELLGLIPLEDRELTLSKIRNHIAEPIGGVEELLDWDQGMGVPHAAYMDIMIPYGAPDPVNFDISVPLADQIDDLGLGQLNAPRFARSEMDIDEMEDVIEGAVEDSFVASFGPNEPKDPLWAYEPPIGDMD